MLDGPDEKEGGGVLSEKSPYEPEEFDPSSLGPDVPDPPDGGASNEVTGLFWQLVVVFNVALLALSLGPMFAYFEGNVDFGIQLTAAGAILFAYGYFRYRRFVRQRDAGESAEDDPDGGDAPDHNG